MSEPVLKLEDAIMKCWQITSDIDDICKWLGDEKTIPGTDIDTNDRTMNMLCGIKELYDIRFDALFEVFAAIMKEHNGELPNRSK